MKRIPLWLILVWVVVGVMGGCFPVLGKLHLFPMFVGWIGLGVLVAADVVWILVAILSRPAKKKPKASVAFTGDGATFNRVLRETEEAVARYLKTAVGKGSSRRRLLYERPWFLLCGPSKAGKTSLLKGSGLHFPVTYPSEQDGMLIRGSDNVTWHFANEAVWIDIPGSYMEETGRSQWQSLIGALAKVRPERPIDGIACVVNGLDIMNSDDVAVRDTARLLRSRVDEVIAMWGIEFPVYLIFNQADRIPGFAEFFGGKPQLAQKHILGATLTSERQRMMPRVAFAEEFNLLCASLEAIRLDMLHDEKDGGRKRHMCRFAIHFEGMQEKLGAYVAEIFRPSSYVGKPIFRGFYFTSCLPVEPQQQASRTSEPSVGMTIVNHPLNPKRLSPTRSAPESTASAAPQVRSTFVLPIFGSIMVRDRVLVKTTAKRSQQELLRFGVMSAVIAVAMVLVGGLVLAARNGSERMIKRVESQLAQVRDRGAGSVADEYAQLDNVRIAIEDVRKAEGKAGFSLGFYRGKHVLAELEKTFNTRAQRLIVGPTVRYLEYRMRGSLQTYGELTGEQYQALYSGLKAYLSMSEAVSTHPKDIDTTFLRTMISEAVTQTLLATFEQSRLPQQLETVLANTIGLHLRLLRSLRCPLIQESQPLVAEARGRLQRLPDAQNLYQTVINRLLPDAPVVTLDQLLNRTSEGVLKSELKMSALFTQQGFEETVDDALGQAAKNPLNIDWVIGLTKDQVPEGMLDAGQLREQMVDAYCKDFQDRWVQFLTSVSMEPFGDIARSARMLQMLASPRSELEVLLETVAQTAFLNPESKASRLGGSVLDAAGKTKAGKGLAKKADKIENAASAFPMGGQTPFDRVNRFFDPLRAFARSSGGAMSGLQGMRDQMLTLSEKLSQVQSQGEQTLLSVLTGKPDDPLQSSWRFVQTECAGMEPQLADAVRGILVGPLQFTGEAASQVLTRVLNERWQAEIVKPYTARFSGRYPFVSRGEEASFTEVMDFFRPTTGTFWGFYDRVLSAYIVKSKDGWMVRSLGSISLQFNPQLAPSLAAGERIRDIFFKPDGTQRALVMTISPVASNTKAASLEVNGQTFDLSAKTKDVQVTWPLPQAQKQGATLKVLVSADFAQDIAFRGPWGFMKLLAGARLASMSESAFSAKWEVSVQNMYALQQSYRIQVAGADNPFVDKVFERFTCPTDLVKKPGE